MAPSLIFLSLGTHEAPFPRAVDLLLASVQNGDHVLVQHGSTPVSGDLPNFAWRQYMPYDEIIDTMKIATTVACHAGVGTIMTALRVGHLPIVIPRLQRHREHVDDHQCDIAVRLAERGLVTCVASDSSVELVPTSLEISEHDKAVGASERLRTAVAEAADRSHARHRSLLNRTFFG
jgi:UDP-N-acetylglucosamine transferase subunit ALG13